MTERYIISSKMNNSKMYNKSSKIGKGKKEYHIMKFNF